MTFNEGAATQRPFVDRNPTAGELELFRLVLSTFQDGSGQEGSGTLPGWRDLERTVAEMTGGTGTENKSVFDVLVPGANGQLIGISCKMRGELARVERDGRVTIELSNSSGQMWSVLGKYQLTTANYKANAAAVGKALLELVETRHIAATPYRGQAIDLNRSFFLVLQWDKKTARYQLFKFGLSLPNPATLNWYFTTTYKGHLNGDDKDSGRVFEWYGESGGQLKYFPLAATALWKSPEFKLEPLPAAVAASLSLKAASYFPDLWEGAQAK